MLPFEPEVYADRRRRLETSMIERGVDTMFIPPSGDLEYFTGVRRRRPTFGNISYAHHWVFGAFLRPGHDPLLILPRMVAEFDLPQDVPGEVFVINETDDATAAFERIVRGFGSLRTIAVEQRTWAETVLALSQASNAKLVNAMPLTNPLRRIKSDAEIAMMRQACRVADNAMGVITGDVLDGAVEGELAESIDSLLHADGSRGVSFDTAVWGMGESTQRDATDRETSSDLRRGTGVSFDFGAVIAGYCSDFGRTVALGEPDSRFVDVYETVIAAQAAGIAAVRPGALASEIDAACRKVIDDAGYGAHFRHRTGHCIGLDVHEYPFISEEDHTPLEVGMTFTIEPSIFWPGHVGARIEDIIVVTENGGTVLNEYSTDMVVTDADPSGFSAGGGSPGGCNHDL
jgi:Xaa-Pro aminopeptidase